MAKAFEAYIPGLDDMLRDLKGLDKHYQNDLREASKDIAARHMVPAWQAAAMNAGPWGERIAATVRAKKDRIPAVSIGFDRKAFSGGASVNMVRFPSHGGQVRPEIPAAFTKTAWMSTVKPAYIEGAVKEWVAAIDRVCDAWGRGRDY
jgi:hypothetical protein